METRKKNVSNSFPADAQTEKRPKFPPNSCNTYRAFKTHKGPQEAKGKEEEWSILHILWVVDVTGIILIRIRS